jgi:hypothetical protein
MPETYDAIVIGTGGCIPEKWKRCEGGSGIIIILS